MQAETRPYDIVRESRKRITISGWFGDISNALRIAYKANAETGKDVGLNFNGVKIVFTETAAICRYKTFKEKVPMPGSIRNVEEAYFKVFRATDKERGKAEARRQRGFARLQKHINTVCTFGFRKGLTLDRLERLVFWFAELETRLIDAGGAQMPSNTIEVFGEVGLHPNVNIRNEGESESAYLRRIGGYKGQLLYIIGQCLGTIQIAGQPHYMVHKFADDVRKTRQKRLSRSAGRRPTLH